MALATNRSDRLDVSRRPRSLMEVEERALERGSIDALLREFLDEFYVESDIGVRRHMLDAEPRLTGVDRVDAYLGAVGEHLARRNGLDIPRWTSDKKRFLKRPYFPAGLESLKATLIVESPIAFRRRMIFVDKDPLYRPRRDEKGFGSDFSGPSA